VSHYLQSLSCLLSPNSCPPPSFLHASTAQATSRGASAPRDHLDHHANGVSPSLGLRSPLPEVYQDATSHVGLPSTPHIADLPPHARLCHTPYACGPSIRSLHISERSSHTSLEGQCSRYLLAEGSRLSPTNEPLVGLLSPYENHQYWSTPPSYQSSPTLLANCCIIRSVQSREGYQIRINGTVHMTYILQDKGVGHGLRSTLVVSTRNIVELLKQ
jgi:hypothetical protein